MRHRSSKAAVTPRYSINEHKHRLAAWAAATAARASSLCRFNVQKAVEILESAGFDEGFATPEMLPAPGRIDAKHRAWRERVIREARQRKIKFTHGVAAKLINVYLKVRFVVGGYHDHP